MLAIGYHDTTLERSLIDDGVNAPESIRAWSLATRKNAGDLATLQTFYDAHRQAIPFYWYNPYDIVSGQNIGSNYDATGVATQGRRIVVFRSDWSANAADPARTEVAFEIQEIG